MTIEDACKGVLECESCGTYTIRNWTESTVTIEVFEATKNVLIHTLEVPTLSKLDFTFSEDGIYVLKYNNKNIVVNVMCSIDACRNKLLKALMCRDKGGCCDDSYLNNRLANMESLYRTYLALVEPFVDLSLRWTNNSIVNNLDRFRETGKLKEQILEFCEVCKRGCANCFSWDKGTCL